MKAKKEDIFDLNEIAQTMEAMWRNIITYHNSNKGNLWY